MSDITPVVSSEPNHPFYLTPVWYNTLHQHVFAARQRIDLIQGDAALPHIQTTGQLKFIRLHCLQSLTNYYSPEFLPLATGHLMPDLADFYQDTQQLRTYEMLDLSPLSAAHATAICQRLQQQGFYCEQYQLTTNWQHPQISGIEQFWQLRPTKLKNILRSKKTKLARDSQYQIEIVSDIADPRLSAMLKDYHQVYSKSWKNDEPYPAFIDAIVYAENRAGRVRLGVLTLNGEAVAAQIWFVHQHTAYIFKLSYNNAYRNESVGSILMEAMFNHVIGQDKVTCVDFLTGDDKYKADWMSVARPLYGVKAYNTRTLKGACCAFLLWFKARLQPVKPATETETETEQ